MAFHRDTWGFMNVFNIVPWRLVRIQELAPPQKDAAWQDRGDVYQLYKGYSRVYKGKGLVGSWSHRKHSPLTPEDDDGTSPSSSAVSALFSVLATDD